MVYQRFHEEEGPSLNVTTLKFLLGGLMHATKVVVRKVVVRKGIQPDKICDTL